MKKSIKKLILENKSIIKINREALKRGDLNEYGWATVTSRIETLRDINKKLEKL